MRYPMEKMLRDVIVFPACLVEWDSSYESSGINPSNPHGKEVGCGFTFNF